MLASELVGKDGKVISFEPTPRTFASLSENAAGKNNISIYNNAVLDTETEIEFYDYGPKYSAFNSFKKRESDAIFFKDTAKSFVTKTVSIDSFCKKNHVVPTFIKIDAEGSEYLIV
jgi:FkbM family methyltransferase